MPQQIDPAALRASLLAWYDGHRRVLPWRAPPGRRAAPYHVWLSEIMLQQTTVATVGPYYRDFLARWPTVDALAAAELDQVLHAWQGLGYYARARNLHKCAKVVSREFGGQFPASEAALRALPGVGTYTAAAIAAIAFDLPATVVDGNVERVMARLHAVETPLPTAKRELRALAAELTPQQRAGDFAQATMDLGATICLPRQPLCARCPWQESCRARAAGIAGELPRKLPKPARPTRHGVGFWLQRADGAVLFRRRAERGLLGGMMEIPSTEWREAPWDAVAAMRAAPHVADWRPLAGGIEHTFTHFHLELSLMAAVLPANVVMPAGLAGAVWCRPAEFARLALPTVMKKLCRHGLTAAGLRSDAKARRRASGDSAG